MRHKLLNNLEDYKKFILNLKYENGYGCMRKFDKEVLEEVFNIRFISVTGKISIIDDSESELFYKRDHKLLSDTDNSIYSNDFVFLKSANVPKFPCIVVYIFSEIFSNSDIETQILDFVELKEFKL